MNHIQERESYCLIIRNWSINEKQCSTQKIKIIGGAFFICFVFPNATNVILKYTERKANTKRQESPCQTRWKTLRPRQKHDIESENFCTKKVGVDLSTPSIWGSFSLINSWFEDHHVWKSSTISLLKGIILHMYPLWPSLLLTVPCFPWHLSLHIQQEIRNAFLAVSTH